MKRRTVLKLTASALLAAGIFAGPAFAEGDVLKFGASAPKTGPLAGGSAVTHLPPISASSNSASSS